MASGIILSPWKGGTPRRLSKALNMRLVAPKETPGKVRGSPKFLINWGCITTCNIPARTLLNYPEVVRIASNKARTFRALMEHKLPTLEFTEHDAQALAWNQTASVIGHFDLHGHSGEGFKIFKKGEGITAEDAAATEIYTKYFPKKKEVRIHVIRTGPEIFAHMYLEKKRVTDPEKKKELGLDPNEVPSTFIRTHANGWIYARDVEEDKELSALGVSAIKSLGLHYGAVDILVKDKEARIGEINTAPGLMGQALEFYIKNLTNLMETYERAH